MKLFKIVLLTMFSLLLFVAGCTDRGVNYDRDTVALSEGGLVEKVGAHVFHEELLFQINNQLQQMRMVGYLPKATIDSFIPVPMLILLPPQDADAYFFVQHGLKELADEMISSGEIQPMAILCIPNDQIFGGYFFAGESPAAGFYDDLIGSELVRFAEEEFFALTLRSTDKRAIGGVGMGAYGAFRAAMLNPNVFGAVSGVAGPMDFDGADGASGFLNLFGDALNEQGITGADDLATTYDYQTDWHISRLFIGAGFAFSPHITEYFYTPIDTTTRVLYRLDSVQTVDTLVPAFSLTNAVTIELFENLPNSFVNASKQEIDPDSAKNRFHLPFDNTGAVLTPVWDLWMQNNLQTIFESNTAIFNGVDIWIGNSNESTFGNYNSQTDSWVSTLKAQGLQVDEFDLKGYDGHPATKDQYVYDYLREMLKFHSDKFGN